MAKMCTKCGCTKAESEFYTRATGNLHSWCIVCMKALRVERNPEIAAYQKRRRRSRTETERGRAKDYLLQYHFGITLEQYEALLEAQDNCCAICGKENGVDLHNGTRTKQLSVDHDHKTGLVRGLLCNDCNRAIGQLKDDPDLLRKAANYLDQWKESHKDASSTSERLLDELLKL